MGLAPSVCLMGLGYARRLSWGCVFRRVRVRVVVSGYSLQVWQCSWNVGVSQKVLSHPGQRFRFTVYFPSGFVCGLWCWHVHEPGWRHAAGLWPRVLQGRQIIGFFLFSLWRWRVGILAVVCLLGVGG